MSKYFAKYLPVEGEIKLWDAYTTEGVIIPRSITNWSLADMGAMDAKKVKLFLCSRDIKVGDKFKYQDEEDICVELLEGDVTGEKDQYSAKACFKVIGEISKEAIWVKEGDEFDEKEVWKQGLVRREIKYEVGVETRTLWGDRVKIVELSNDLNFYGHRCEYLDEAELNHHITCRKGETYDYHPNVLGYIDLYYYKIKGPCGHFH